MRPSSTSIKGIEFYNKGYEANYRKAAAEFEAALAIDPKYSQAALYAGRAYNALYEDKKSLEYFKEAISIDPDYLEARSSYAGALLDSGDMDEAIRQLNVVTQRDPKSGMAFYLLSQAFARKGDFDDAIQAARQAIQLPPQRGGPLLARRIAAPEKPVSRSRSPVQRVPCAFQLRQRYGWQDQLLPRRIPARRRRKKRAAQTDIWKELRGQANTGLCDCEWLQKKYDTAIHYCQTALTFTPNDLFTNYRLGILYAEQYNKSGSVSLLAAARKHFENVVEQNPDANEADRSRKYIRNIDAVLSQQSSLSHP